MVRVISVAEPDFRLLLPLVRREWPQEDGLRTDGEILEFMRQSYSPDHDTLYHLLENGRLAGFARYSLWPRDTADPQEAHLLDISVHEEYCGQGCGRLLLDTVVGDCRKRRLVRLYSRTFISNIPSAAFHRKYGFREHFRTDDSIVWIFDFQEQEDGYGN